MCLSKHLNQIAHSLKSLNSWKKLQILVTLIPLKKFSCFTMYDGNFVFHFDVVSVKYNFNFFYTKYCHTLCLNYQNTVCIPLFKNQIVSPESYLLSIFLLIPTNCPPLIQFILYGFPLH